MSIAIIDWPLHSWPRADQLALAGIVTAIIIAAMPPLRRGLIRGWHELLMRAGFPRRKYARWFIRQWGHYDNPYLDEREDLNLSNTYVPLFFRSEKAGREELSVATAALSNKRLGNLLIEGAPGSGKSTLLKAYGVGVLQDNYNIWRRGRRTIPFLIQLRKLAKALDGQMGITEYLIDQILVSGVGMSPGRARHFLRYTLDRKEALFMMDGLDEVTMERYQTVLEAVSRFKDYHGPDCPTFQARIFITCRRQNFINLRNEWIPAIVDRQCSLAPLRNSDIFNYLNNLRGKFKATNGPEDFIQAVRISGTLDLHRVPLILAMSVGLYARKDYFEIPASIAKLYKVMIEEMLDRHRFKRDPGGGALTFHVGDKYRVLSEFSLYAANGHQGFDEFDKVDLVTFCRFLAPNLDNVRDPDTLVDEIILRSGLLSDVADTGRYVFAHRSIQEYLVAEELWSAMDGDDLLLRRANDPEWRQVIQFYAAGREQRQASTFLVALSQRNPELAGYCLSSARASNESAIVVLEGLKPIDDVRLAALAAATISPRVTVQTMAIDTLRQALSGEHPHLSVISGDIDSVLPLLNSLAGTNAAEIASLVPEIIRYVPSDPRLVEPLWRCLVAPGIESLPACVTIVSRLLVLMGDPESFDELARQEPYTRDFLSIDIRRRAYPFKAGLSLDHNLVTLLAWAEYLEAEPPSNRYFAAKKAGRLDRVENDRRRTVFISLFWPARVLSCGLSAAAVISAVTLLIIHPGQLLLPFGWPTPVLIVSAAYGTWVFFCLFIGFIVTFVPKPKRRQFDIGRYDSRNSGSIVGYLTSVSNFLGRLLLGLIIPLCLSFSALPLLGYSWAIYVPVLLGSNFLYYSCFLNIFNRGRHYYLYRPSPFIDIYDNPRTKHWVSKPTNVQVQTESHQSEIHQVEASR
jgi:hypothetical protein